MPQALLNTISAGVYLVPHGEISLLQDAIRQSNYAYFPLDGTGINNKASFLQACANVMYFPSYFGHNWDAFDECIRDLSWYRAPGYVIWFEAFNQFLEQDPASWNVALRLFRSAVEEWHAQGIPFYVFLIGNPAVEIDVPSLHYKSSE